MMISFSDLKAGDIAEIVDFYENCDVVYKKKLLALGLTRGTKFTVLRKAPLGDPVEIEIRGFNLSIRKNEAVVLKIKRYA